jgi:hypothetical protein
MTSCMQGHERALVSAPSPWHVQLTSSAYYFPVCMNTSIYADNISDIMGQGTCNNNEVRVASQSTDQHVISPAG